MSEYKRVTTESYNNISADYSARDRRSDVSEAPFVYAAINEFAKLMPSNGSILDVGFGGGRDARYLSSLGFKVTGIDNASRMVEIAKSLDPTGKYLLMDFEAISLPAASFDGVWANASLHHVPKAKLQPVLKGISKALKPYGFFRVIIKQGHGEGIRKNKKFNRDILRYFAFYDESELKDIVSRSGFEIISCNSENHEEWLNLLARKK